MNFDSKLKAGLLVLLLVGTAFYLGNITAPQATTQVSRKADLGALTERWCQYILQWTNAVPSCAYSDMKTACYEGQNDTSPLFGYDLNSPTRGNVWLYDCIKCLTLEGDCIPQLESTFKH